MSNSTATFCRCWTTSRDASRVAGNRLYNPSQHLVLRILLARTVPAWVPQEADPEMETNMQGAYEQALLVPAPAEAGRGKRSWADSFAAAQSQWTQFISAGDLKMR